MDMETAAATLQNLLDQVRHLNAVADRHQASIAGMSEFSMMQSALNELRSQMSQMNGGANQQNGYAQTKYLVNHKDLTVESFHGVESKFIDFVEESKTFCDVTDHAVAAALEWIEFQDVDVSESTLISRFGDKLEYINRMLSGYLKVKLKGLAKNWLNSQQTGEGLKNWKAMLHKYDPTTGSTLLDMQNSVTVPGTRCTEPKQVPVMIEKWETQYRKYLSKGFIELGDAMKQNIILRKLPNKMENMIRLQVSLSGKTTTYSTMREEIMKTCIASAGSMATPMDLMKLQEAEDAAALAGEERWSYDEWCAWVEPEEDDAMALGKGPKGGKKGGKSKGKGKEQQDSRKLGKGNVKCSICTRAGHESKDCWCNPKSASYKSDNYAKKTLERMKAQRSTANLEDEDLKELQLENLWPDDMCLIEGAEESVEIVDSEDDFQPAPPCPSSCCQPRRPKKGVPLFCSAKYFQSNIDGESDGSRDDSNDSWDSEEEISVTNWDDEFEPMADNDINLCPINEETKDMKTKDNDPFQQASVDPWHSATHSVPIPGDWERQRKSKLNNSIDPISLNNSQVGSISEEFEKKMALLMSAVAIEPSDRKNAVSESVVVAGVPSDVENTSNVVALVPSEAKNTAEDKPAEEKTTSFSRISDDVEENNV